ncbi:hypothetical protein F0P96_09585 [Hymenobacter busanensis]|uniref:Uncharacterized protein n=1 Tax=Hymenobacter busanensis TaxID=2607656 RepID=A0A7L4ZX69_9BACT|nr:hypothetical protein [Hymenobacter busanensis]KAA9333219.1 hypothetical protein F0P96_09585 [Hymenobacter busanensis]QHJ08104.1 hypothetical protein GUY19_12735 [Hymenobacter busanensis]
MFPSLRLLLAFVLLLGLGTVTASAQIDDRTSARRDARKAVRDARKYPVSDDLKQAHLAVNKHALRPGESGDRLRNPKDERSRYRFDNTGTARVSDPSYQSARRKKKTQPTE